MTKAIEELCAGLKARGVEYRVWDEPEEDICYAQWEADGFFWEAEDRDERMYLCADRLITPEQVIAATLKPMKLTGKLIGDVAKNNWRYSQLPQEGYDWEAIAKELNDMLGQGTCHNAVHPNCRDYWFCCSECEFVAHTNKTVINYCPNCGRKVVTE